MCETTEGDADRLELALGHQGTRRRHPAAGRRVRQPRVRRPAPACRPGAELPFGLSGTVPTAEMAEPLFGLGDTSPPNEYLDLEDSAIDFKIPKDNQMGNDMGLQEASCSASVPSAGAMGTHQVCSPSSPAHPDTPLRMATGPELPAECSARTLRRLAILTTAAFLQNKVFV
jgi:hypothetical protein